VKRKEQFGLTDPSEAEIGKAHSAVFGNKHEGVSSVWEGDNGIIEIANNPKSGVNWFEGLRPMIITYGNSELSGFGVERNPHYRIEGTKYSKGRGGANFVVCVSATDPVRGTQEAECGIEQGFSEVGLFGKEGKHLEKVKGCQGSGKRWNLKVGASGAPVYKANRAYGVLTDLEHCVFWYTGIHQAEEELKVEVLRAPTP